MTGVSWTRTLRTKPHWVAMRSIAVMCFCVAGVLGEFIGERNHQWGVNNSQHLIIWGGFFTGGVVEFLHIYNVLAEPIWAVIPPVGLCYVGIMLAVHEQFRVFWRYLHLVSGLVTFPAVLILIYLPIRAMSIYRKKVEKNEIKTGDKDFTPGWLFWRGRSIENINPVYSDSSAYNTVWPGLVAFFLCLEGVLWFEMAMRMGWYSGNDLPAEVHHPEHAFLAMFIGDIVIVLIIFAIVSFIARRIDRCIKGEAPFQGADIELGLQHEK